MDSSHHDHAQPAGHRQGHAHHHGSGGLCERATIDKVGVKEMRIVIEVIVDGVVLPVARVLAAEAKVDAGNAQVIDKDGIVRTGTKRGQANVRASPYLRPRIGQGF